MTTYILCRSRNVPTHEQIAQALRRVGYDVIVENIRGQQTTSLTAEIRYASNKLPIVIDVMHDLIDDFSEGDDEYWGWFTELLPEESARKGLRRFIFVKHMENADTAAVDTVVNFLQDRADGLVVKEASPATS